MGVCLCLIPTLKPHMQQSVCGRVEADRGGQRNNRAILDTGADELMPVTHCTPDFMSEDWTQELGSL